MGSPIMGYPGSPFWFSALPYHPRLQPRACQGSTLTLLRRSLCQGPDGGSRHVPLCSLPSWTLGNTDEDKSQDLLTLLRSGPISPAARLRQQSGSSFLGSHSKGQGLSWVLIAGQGLKFVPQRLPCTWHQISEAFLFREAKGHLPSNMPPPCFPLLCAQKPEVLQMKSPLFPSNTYSYAVGRHDPVQSVKQTQPLQLNNKEPTSGRSWLLQ